MTYGELVKTVREYLNFTQEQFAHNLDVSFSTINRWENAHTTPSRLAQKRFYEYCKSKEFPDKIQSALFSLQNVEGR